ncbi:MAG TPA: SDR family oxidoreductase [Devosiaceae bacterium]|jgi:NAD(P)-dependent dehydrogenase (short-subunit alcohol dehydrogenase family)|nr:SDR family oxidoreductase [Devosiaceae bacterium]
MGSGSRIAIVTGGGQGIGRTSALALNAEGWTVVVAGRHLEKLEETVGRAGDPTRMAAIVADVGDAASVDALFDETVKRFGRVDLLFNNAGINAPVVPLDQLAVEDLEKIIRVNIIGSFLCARAAMRVMKAQEPQGGRIINNGSVSAYAPRPNQSPYTATKHAITGLTKSITLDGRAFNIACGQIDIGNAATEMSAYMTSGAMQANGTVVPEPRIPSEHIAQTIVHMASLPLEANIPFVTVMASGMPLYGRG